jgi:hypothetical protein
MNHPAETSAGPHRAGAPLGLHVDRDQPDGMINLPTSPICTGPIAMSDPPLPGQSHLVLAASRAVQPCSALLTGVVVAEVMMTPHIWKRRNLDCRPLLTYAIDSTTRGLLRHRPDRMKPEKPDNSPVPSDLSHHGLLTRPAPAPNADSPPPRTPH